jgi:hypothetical protein
VNYAKLLEMNYFYLSYFFKDIKTQDLPSKIWQIVEDALRETPIVWQINLTSI